MHRDLQHAAAAETPASSEANGASARPKPVVERIYAAATEAVATCGLDGLNMEDIAARAGCSRATLYRRTGGKDAIRDAILHRAIARITGSVAQAVEHLDGGERTVQTILATIDTARADPVSAAMLVGPAAANSVTSRVITSVNGTVSQIAGLDHDDTVGCELLSRVSLALLCWPAVDRRTELAIIRQHVFGVRG